MITSVTGSLFTSPAKVLVNTVNTVGVMGKGIAKTFKEVYPEMFLEYQRLCEGGKFKIGNLWLYKTGHKWILNFPTKRTWRQPSRVEYLEAGFQKFSEVYADLGIASIAFPRLGCGNGELDWDTQVKPLMLRYLQPLPIDILVYEFGASHVPPEHKDQGVMSTWLRSEPRALAFVEMWADLRTLIGERLRLREWEGATEFEVWLTDIPVEGLRLRMASKSVLRLAGILEKLIPSKWWPRIVGPEEVFIPQEAMLDLWQNIRAYGFCVSQVMPEGLDALAPCVMAMLAKLAYMTPVELSTTTRREAVVEKGLQLFAYPATNLARPRVGAYAV